MAAEDELFFNRIKLDLYTAAKVFHKMGKIIGVAESIWFDLCGYVYTGFCCQPLVRLEKLIQNAGRGRFWKPPDFLSVALPALLSLDLND